MDDMDRAQVAQEAHLADALARRRHAEAHAAPAPAPICEDCGGPIPAGRLRALPTTRRCIDCATLAERPLAYAAGYR